MTERYFFNMLDQDIRKSFGVRLKRLRRQKGWTQKELAARVEIGFSQFNKYELGLHVPQLEKLILLAKLLDTTLDYLLMGDEQDGTALNNTRMLKRFREAEYFQPEDQEAVIRMLDGMILKNRTRDVMTLDDS